MKEQYMFSENGNGNHKLPIIFLRPEHGSSMPEIQFAGARIRFDSALEHQFAIYLARAYRADEPMLSLEDGLLGLFDLEAPEADPVAFEALQEQLETLQEVLNYKLARNRIPFSLQIVEDDEGNTGYAFVETVENETSSLDTLSAEKKIKKGAVVQYESSSYIYQPRTDAETKVLYTVVNALLTSGRFHALELRQNLKPQLMRYIMEHKDVSDKKGIEEADMKTALQDLFKSAYNKASYERMHGLVSSQSDEYHFIMHTVPHFVTYVRTHVRNGRDKRSPESHFTEEWAIRRISALIGNPTNIG